MLSQDSIQILSLLEVFGKRWLLPGPFELEEFPHKPWILDGHGHDIAREQGSSGQRYGKHLHTIAGEAHALCCVQ